MALYAYRAMTPQGRIVSGNLDASNPTDLELRLRRLELDLVTQRLASTSTLLRGRRIKRVELITFCFHLEQLMRSGVPIIEAISDLRDTLTQGGFREVVSNLVESIEGGLSLSEAMALHPTAFDSVFIGLIQAGEQSGQLPMVLAKLTENLKWQDELAEQTKKLLMYPAFVGSVILGAITVMMVKIVPDLVNVIRTLAPELPPQTRMLIAISQVFKDWWPLILGAPLVVVVALALLVQRSPGARLRFDAMKLKLPFFGPILFKLILARFATFFAMMYSSRVNLLECLQAAERMTGNRMVEETLREAGRQIADGAGISQAFLNVQLFPPLVLRMLRVGETTGALDKALENVAYFYDRDVRGSIARAQ